MLNKTALSLQTQRGTRWCIQQHSQAWGGGRGGEEHGAAPGWHIPLHAPLSWAGVRAMGSVLWGNPAGQAWGQHLRLGCAPGKDNPPKLGIVDGASFDRGVWCDRPNSSSSPSIPPCASLPFPARNFHHYYYFPTLFAFPAPATVHCVQKGLSTHRGGNVSSPHPLFLPKCNVGVQDFTPHYSSALQPAVPRPQISPSSCCKPFLPGGPLPWILQTPNARILASKNQVLGCTWSLAAIRSAGEGNRGGSISAEETNSGKKIICHERNTF